VAISEEADMEQRQYRTALTPEQIGDYLVQEYNQQRRTDAQRLGTGDSVLVQVRQGREERQHLALTIGITRGDAAGAGATAAAPGISHPADADPAPAAAPAADPPPLAITLGEQQWFTSGHLDGGVVGSLVGALFTPWALFGLIWPVSHRFRTLFAPDEAWTTIENYILTQGGQRLSVTTLAHPHMDAS